MQLDKASHQSKAETGAARRRVVAVIHPRERFEDAVELRLRYSRTVVSNHELKVAVLIQSRGDIDAPAVGSEFDCIGHEIDHDLLQCALVRIKNGCALIDGNAERLVALA